MCECILPEIIVTTSLYRNRYNFNTNNTKRLEWLSHYQAHTYIYFTEWYVGDKYDFPSVHLNCWVLIHADVHPACPLVHDLYVGTVYTPDQRHDEQNTGHPHCVFWWENIDV